MLKFFKDPEVIALILGLIVLVQFQVFYMGTNIVLALIKLGLCYWLADDLIKMRDDDDDYDDYDDDDDDYIYDDTMKAL